LEAARWRRYCFNCRWRILHNQKMKKLVRFSNDLDYQLIDISRFKLEVINDFGDEYYCKLDNQYAFIKK
jgi:hypothetical protein